MLRDREVAVEGKKEEAKRSVKRQRASESLCAHACVCVCVCERERERERKWERERERDYIKKE